METRAISILVVLENNCRKKFVPSRTKSSWFCAKHSLSVCVCVYVCVSIHLRCVGRCWHPHIFLKMLSPICILDQSHTGAAVPIPISFYIILTAWHIYLFIDWPNCNNCSCPLTEWIRRSQHLYPCPRGWCEHWTNWQWPLVARSSPRNGTATTRTDHPLEGQGERSWSCAQKAGPNEGNRKSESIALNV